MPRLPHKTLVAASTLVAAAVGGLVLLRPTRGGRESLPEPAGLPAAARAVLKHRMDRHGGQMRDLLTSVILLDEDATARTAGAIHDEPALARPIGGDELNGLLPARFFVLQDDLKVRAAALVRAAAIHDHAAMADELGAITKSCVACHDAYLNAR